MTTSMTITMMSVWWWDVCLFDGLDRVGGGHTWDPTVIWLNLHQPHRVRWGNWFKIFLSHFVAGDVLRHWLAHHDIDNPSHTPFHRELKNQARYVCTFCIKSLIYFPRMHDHQCDCDHHGLHGKPTLMKFWPARNLELFHCTARNVPRRLSSS